MEQAPLRARRSERPGQRPHLRDPILRDAHRQGRHTELRLRPRRQHRLRHRQHLGRRLLAEPHAHTKRTADARILPMAESHLVTDVAQLLAQLPPLRIRHRRRAQHHRLARDLLPHRPSELGDRALEGHKAVERQELLAALRISGLEHAQMTACRGRHVPGISPHLRFPPLGFGGHPITPCLGAW
jgi:hypothetical protein